MTDPAPAVTGRPLRWLRLDGLVLLAAALVLFAATHQPWWLVPAVILLPDLFMLGYLRGTRVGAAVYNLGHSYLLPAAMSLAGAVGHHPLTLALGLLWLAHIGMDRLARYGLKYDVSFQHTHLGAPRLSEPGDARLPSHRAAGSSAARPGFARRRELWRLPAYLVVVAVGGPGSFGRRYLDRVSGGIRLCR